MEQFNGTLTDELGNPTTALDMMLSHFGEAGFTLAVGRTMSITPGALPPTTEAEQWVRENPGIDDDYDLVYGFFAPQGGEFDFNAFNRSLEGGDREPVRFEFECNLRF